MRILSKEEATKVERPAGMAPYVWPEPVNVAISACGPVSDHVYGRARNGDPLDFALAVNFFETLYAHGYAIVKLDEEPAAVDLRPWFVTVTAVREVSHLGHKPSLISAIKALQLVGTDELGWHLDLADAKAAVDAVRLGTPFVFTVADEVAAKDAKTELESAGMTIRVGQEAQV